MLDSPVSDGLVGPEKGALLIPLMAMELRSTSYTLLRISKRRSEISHPEDDMVLHVGDIFAFSTHMNVKTMSRSAFSSPFHVYGMIDSRVSDEH
jgi:hypothetical protein